MPPITKRVVIVGGGILGACTAHALHERGETDVLLVSRMGPGSGASGVGAGLLCQAAWDPVDVRLVRESREVYRRAAAEPLDGVKDLAWHEPGNVTLVPPDREGRAKRARRLLRNADVPAKLLTPEEARDLPGLDTLDLDGVASVLHTPTDGWSLVTDAIRRLLGEAHVEGGVDVRWFDPVERVEPGADGPRVVLGGDRAVEAEHVVVAAGAWTPQLLSPMGLPVPIRGYTAQLALVDWAPPEGLPLLHDAARGFYARPEGQGKLLVGDGTRLEPVEPEPDAEFQERGADRRFKEEVAEHITTRVPAAGTARIVSSWSGIEAATPDRHPLAGPDPRMEGLHLLVGGNGFGFMRAPALGDAVAAGILGEAPGVDASRYHPSRFEERWDVDFTPREGFTL